ncbi:SMP-30/gluconolactonase/LRE family protein [Burkholderia gladioli]|uniref:SMP-30/gluconolaconase/LRE domain-containing protein n=1 Tax=Burkholderia gladioli (strain BSR3) TaxID=999541 RepID=F2LPE9_BURGS|nr:SMP-30/gluconolactonase/LRE family protein [Burkholderia gladioli]AEA65092.1 SMP-30/gluconolaconase/LRE domain-containing protein [Burkholderia gladioli BSR3]MBW5286154.1 SMP-30/gluconolactonase/LRE family protein [Burkholderia gladioli]
MFFLNAPEVRETEVFTRMPDAFRKPEVRTDWARANRGGLPTDSFLEGPVWDPAGHLFVTDIPHGRIFRISANGEWELVVQYEGEPNGMKRYDDAHLLITDYRNGLMLLDIERGVVRPFLERRNSERFRGVNDLSFDSRGNLYFTDQGQSGLHDPTGRVYRLSPDGKLDMLLGNCPSPNGLVLSPDEKVLFVGMTRGNSVWRVPLQADGSVSKVGQFFTSYGPSGPDGLTVDNDGRILVANPGLGYVWVLNHRGEPVEILTNSAGTSLTNLCFGGEDMKTLYMTESVSGTVLKTRMKTAGPLPHRARQ